MTHQAQLTELLIKFGDHIDLPHFANNGDDPARLVFDKTIIVNITLANDEDNIQIFSPISAVVPGNTEALYKKMLEANLFWQGTGGGTLGLSDEGQIILAYQTPLQHMDCQKLEYLLSAFVDAAETWKKNLSGIDTPQNKHLLSHVDLRNALKV